MWAHLRTDPQDHGPTQNAPNPETTMNIRRNRSSTDSVASANPRQRRRQRLTFASCCSCTRDARCSADVRTRCECRDAGRECSNCDPRHKCRNRPTVVATPPPPPGDGVLCLPAETPAAPAATLPEQPARSTGVPTDRTPRPTARTTTNSPTSSTARTASPSPLPAVAALPPLPDLPGAGTPEEVSTTPPARAFFPMPESLTGYGP